MASDRPIACICSGGGHLTELQALLPAIGDRPHFFVTYPTPRTRQLPDVVFAGDLGRAPHRYLRETVRALRLLRRRRPAALLSTGSEIAIPYFLAARLLGIPRIYVESVARITAPSGTTNVLRRIGCDIFVQWPDLVPVVPGARYAGGIL